MNAFKQIAGFEIAFGFQLGTDSKYNYSHIFDWLQSIGMTEQLPLTRKGTVREQWEILAGNYCVQDGTLMAFGKPSKAPEYWQGPQPSLPWVLTLTQNQVKVEIASGVVKPEDEKYLCFDRKDVSCLHVINYPHPGKKKGGYFCGPNYWWMGEVEYKRRLRERLDELTRQKVLHGNDWGFGDWPRDAYADEIGRTEGPILREKYEAIRDQKNAAHHAQRRDSEKLAESIRELKEEVVLAEAKLIELRRKLTAEERAIANLQ